ncbi:MAG: hypothetical protein IJR57_06325 [Ruminococcus sp.]|nr:hypothetical protein [Ruminococcus sp.]
MKAQDLMNAFESLDSELLYAAHAEQHKKRSFGKLPIAAAILLMLISGAVLYGVFVAPVSTIWLESRESVTITLNSRGKVLSASGYTGLDGKSAEYAVGYIVRDMIDSGALDEDENSLMIGTRKISEDVADAVFDSVQDVFAQSRFHGATISMPCSGNGVRYDIVELLADMIEGLSAESLRGQSVNDLNLLLHEYGVGDGVTFSGEPSEGMYIGKAAAKERALQNAKLDGEITVSYSVYHGRLVYLVRIVKDDRAKAYFINASNGTIETAFATVTEKLEKMIEAEVKKSSPPVTYDDQSVPLVVTNDPQIFETANNAQPTTATELPRVLPAAQTTTAPPENNTPQPTTAPIPLMTEKPKESPSTQSQTLSQPEDIYLRSFGVSIPCDAQINLFDMTLDEVDDDSCGKGISFTPLESCTDRLNWLSVSPPIPKSQVNKMGKQDRYVAIYGSYADFIRDSFADLGDESTLGDHLKRLIADNNIDEDFFRENALLAVTYHDSFIYYNEIDSVCAIYVKGDTAYVDLLRKTTANGETDYVKVIFYAVVKKEDFKNITKFQLLLTKQR